MPQTNVTATVAAVSQELYPAASPACTTYTVENTSAVDTLFVFVPGLHASTADAVAIGPGRSRDFRYGVRGITEVRAWSGGGAIVVNHGKVAII